MAVYVVMFVPKILGTLGRGSAGLYLSQNEHDHRSDDERQGEPSVQHYSSNLSTWETG
jgi:hypothetical protein